jgi:hypothetical protein
MGQIRGQPARARDSFAGIYAGFRAEFDFAPVAERDGVRGTYNFAEHLP